LSATPSANEVSSIHDRAPAREFFDLVDDFALERLAHFDWLYLSGVTLSLNSDSGRARLVELLATARRNGGRVARQRT
jgi:2-dehydro-3-deoxygluconokinase